MQPGIIASPSRRDNYVGYARGGSRVLLQGGGCPGTETNIELHMPDTWSRRSVMDGGGGFVGVVANVALAYGGLQEPYATVGTDTGHSVTADWTHNNLERLVSLGHQAVHCTAVTA